MTSVSPTSHHQMCCEVIEIPASMNTKMKQVWSLTKRTNRLMAIYGIEARLIFQPNAPEAELLGYPTIKICTHDNYLGLHLYLTPNNLWKATEGSSKDSPESLGFLSKLPEILFLQATYALAAAKFRKLTRAEQVSFKWEDHRDIERYINLWMPFVYSDVENLGAEAEDFVERLGRLVDLDYSMWPPLAPDPNWPGCDIQL
jgi:hypothetical protein